MLNISKEWYKKVFEQYVISQYGSLDVLKQYDVVRDGKIRDYMCKQVRVNYPLNDNEIPMARKKSDQLCNEYIKKYRI